jgi:predicted GIY-YIG superfamily endonuclease
MKFSEKRTLEKRKKFEKELRTELSKWDSAYLKNATTKLFHYLNAEGTSEHFVKFILSSKFGEANSYVAIGAWKEFVVDSFNQVWNPDQVSVNEYGFRCSYVYRPSMYGHAFVDYAVDAKFSRLITNLSASDYKQAIGISPYLFLDTDTNAFGYVVIPYVLSHDEVLEWRKERIGELLDVPKANTAWQVEEPPIWKPSSEFSSGKLEYTSGFQFIFGSLEALIQHLPEIEQVNVREYSAKRGSKQTIVRSYTKRKPIRRSKIQNKLSNHIVYKVYDCDNNLRYIGEGLPNRPDHVFSGASHNPKINEHYFTKEKPMRVEIVATELTKSDALAMERLLLLKHRKDDLWNTKDYHPNADLNIKSITDETIFEMIDLLKH